MASDWIKMRTDLYRDPKVCVIADLLLDSDSDLARYVNQNYQRDMTVTRNVMRNAVVGALLSVWGVMRHRGKRNGDDLSCYGVGIAVIDDISDMRGFGEAMARVGWAIEEDDCVVFPRFFADYNAEPGVQGKSKNAERQRRFRERKKAESNYDSNVTNNVTRDVTVTPREEKRREEIKDIPPNPQGGDGGRKVKIDETPYQEICEAYRAALPSLPQPDDSKHWNKTRKGYVKARWDENESRQSVDWWQRYFGYVARSAFLTGKTPEAFEATFDWLVKPTNMQKVCEGNYHKVVKHGAA